MFENPRRGRQARNFTTNAPKILDRKSSSEQIFSQKLPLGAPEATFEMTPGFKPFTVLYTVYRSSNARPLEETFLTLFFFRDNFDSEVFL